MEKAKNIAGEVRHFELAADQSFQDAFLRAMSFDFS
jgi:uncharacterized 2Fe-2S/4Fe-4S cluster protein (DUF4445 family)